VDVISCLEVEMKRGGLRKWVCMLAPQLDYVAETNIVVSGDYGYS